MSNSGLLIVYIVPEAIIRVARAFCTLVDIIAKTLRVGIRIVALVDIVTEAFCVICSIFALLVDIVPKALGGIRGFGTGNGAGLIVHHWCCSSQGSHESNDLSGEETHLETIN
ncbi:hypothetical protein GGR57DRAFT_453630 [Xylariaceae sp. FL1272]|nr:hypothetical protein GGR57DRAFT_453630 [Xylariaceae sp. FL1272]